MIETNITIQPIHEEDGSIRWKVGDEDGHNSYKSATEAFDVYMALKREAEHKLPTDEPLIDRVIPRGRTHLVRRKR